MAGRNGGRRKTKEPLDPSRQLPVGLARALADPKSSADSQALLENLIEVWGGIRQLAIDLHAEYQKAPAGGMTRQRILEMLQRLIITNTTHEIGRAIKPADMSDDDLEELALKYVKRATDASTPSGQQEEG